MIEDPEIVSRFNERVGEGLELQDHAKGWKAVAGGYLDMVFIVRDFIRFLLTKDPVTRGQDSLGPKSYSPRNSERGKR